MSCPPTSMMILCKSHSPIVESCFEYTNRDMFITRLQMCASPVAFHNLFVHICGSRVSERLLVVTFTLSSLLSHWCCQFYMANMWVTPCSLFHIVYPELPIIGDWMLFINYRILHRSLMNVCGVRRHWQRLITQWHAILWSTDRLKSCFKTWTAIAVRKRSEGLQAMAIL